jgi:roadblock/LC7 domain-containing protein
LTLPPSQRILISCEKACSTVDNLAGIVMDTKVKRTHDHVSNKNHNPVALFCLAIHKFFVATLGANTFFVQQRKTTHDAQ